MDRIHEEDGLFDLILCTNEIKTKWYWAVENGDGGMWKQKGCMWNQKWFMWNQKWFMWNQKLFMWNQKVGKRKLWLIEKWI